MKIKWFYILIILVLFIGIRITRDLYNESGIIPLWQDDEKVFLEIEELLKVDTGIVCILIPQKIYYRIGKFYTDDITLLNKFKKDWTFKKPGKMYACGYHYNISVYKQGELLCQ